MKLERSSQAYVLSLSAFRSIGCLVDLAVLRFYGQVVVRKMVLFIGQTRIRIWIIIDLELSQSLVCPQAS